jgi:hypothetical protein
VSTSSTPPPDDGDWREELGGQLGRLSVQLGAWEDRDDTEAQPDVVRAGNEALSTIDAMLAGLHRLRSQLVTEVREHQDAMARRTDEILRRGRDWRDTGSGPGWSPDDEPEG